MDNDLVFTRYYNLSLRYLSYRPRSEKEVIDYLNEKSKRSELLTPEIIDQIIERLKKYKFIDDEIFVKFWFEQRIKYKRKPSRMVYYELIKKGIEKGLIEKYISENENNNEHDLENAKILAQKKSNFYRNLDDEKRKEKIKFFLIRKGFSFDIVKKVTENI